MPAFTSQSSSASNITLVPDKTLAWAFLTGIELKNSRTSNGQYAALELTLEQPSADGSHKKIFANVMDPDDDRHSEGAMKMGFAALSRMIEAAGLVQIGVEASYHAINAACPTFESVLQVLNNRRVAIKVKLVPEKDGYAAKNDVGDWLSPNPASSSYADWQRLLAGDTAPKLSRAAAPAPTLAPTLPGVAAPPAAAPAPAFAAPTAAPAFGAPAAARAPTAPAAWLAQAQAPTPATPPPSRKQIDDDIPF